MSRPILLAAFMAASLVLPGIAHASTPPVPAPATDEEIAAARTIADAEIAKINVGDLFENATDSASPKARHKASGLICPLGEGSSGIHLYEGLPRGDDVSCSSTELGITETVYATRYPQRVSARQVVEASVAAIHQRFKKVKPFKGTSVSISTDGVDTPRPETARFTAELDGKKVYTRSSAVAIGDWIIAQRTTGPVKEAMMIDILAEMSLNLQVTDIIDPKPKAPLAPPAAPAEASTTS